MRGLQELSEQAQDSQYLYVYGIAPLKDKMRFGFAGLKKKPLAIVQHADIAAVVSSYPVLNPLVNEDDAMQHAEVLKRLANKTAVIPMAFGAVFKDEATLKTVLEKTYAALKECLELIGGKIELGVKVVRKDLSSDYDGKVAEIISSLKSLCVKDSKADNFSDRLLLNYSFLVERTKFSKFSNEVAKLEKRHKELKFIYTGPWPPYSFVNISIRGENVHNR